MLNSKKYFFVLIFLITLLFDTSVFATSWDGESSTLSLKGVEGISVYIRVTKDFEALGLSAEKLKNDAELKLRLAGIKISRLEDNAKIPGEPVLSIMISLQKINDTTYMGSCLLQLEQYVLLERDPHFRTYSTTWSLDTQSWICQEQEVNASIRTDISGALNYFINTYLSVNPK